MAMFVNTRVTISMLIPPPIQPLVSSVSRLTDIALCGRTQSCGGWAARKVPEKKGPVISMASAGPLTDEEKREERKNEDDNDGF